jgi:tetratricopeptide (TPR) repeat protein
LMRLERRLEAISAYASSIRRDRTYMLAYLNRGLAYLATDEPHKAEYDFDQAIRHEPVDARAWFNRGVAQARQREYREAIKSYRLALEIDPGYEAARRNLAAAERLAARGREAGVAGGSP